MKFKIFVTLFFVITFLFSCGDMEVEESRDLQAESDASLFARLAEGKHVPRDSIKWIFARCSNDNSTTCPREIRIDKAAHVLNVHPDMLESISSDAQAYFIVYSPEGKEEICDERRIRDTSSEDLAKTIEKHGKRQMNKKMVQEESRKLDKHLKNQMAAVADSVTKDSLIAIKSWETGMVTLERELERANGELYQTYKKAKNAGGITLSQFERTVVNDEEQGSIYQDFLTASDSLWDVRQEQINKIQIDAKELIAAYKQKNEDAKKALLNNE